MLQYCVLLSWCTKVRAVLAGQSTVSGFDLAWFSSLCSKHIRVFCLYDAIYIYIKLKFYVLTSFSLPFSELSLVRLALDVVD